MSLINKDRTISVQLKGLSILAVVGLHLLTFVPPNNFFKTPTNYLFLSIDQVLRFCVPVFIFLSGFGLSLKYQNQKLNLKQFYLSRLSKLLPLYLLWSTYYLFLSEWIKPWWKVLETGPVWKILALGWADYHLYFVSVILQLYLLYPVLNKLAKKHLNLTLYLSLVMQIGLYAYFSFTQNPPPDQIQNTFFLSWIFYFVFGIYLSLKKNFISTKLSLFLIFFGLLFSILDTYHYLNISRNIILAIRFSKIPLILYSLGFISFFLSLPKNKLNQKTLSWLGQNSYLIYLAHPVLIHLGHFNLQKVPLIPVLISFVVMLLISTKIKIPNLSGFLVARK